MYTLIAFATQWGSKHGGINSFNADFLVNFGAAYHHGAQIVCVVPQHTPEALDEAARANVRLLALPYVPDSKYLESSLSETIVDLLRKSDITFDPEQTIWLGHDLITGDAAIGAARAAGGRSAVIHHMSYSDYESYAAGSDSAQRKTKKQTTILEQADVVLAIGPLLRNAASDRLGAVDAAKSVHMLVPGLPEIDSKDAPKTFVAFLSGRLTADAARIKQGHLGVAAFAEAEKKARKEGVPEALKRQPKLLLRGVDFVKHVSEAELNTAEAELKQFAEDHAKAVVNLQTLPYTEDRQELYSELSAASVALMPSWHEGFGLVAWEAIAAGVPLIIGENSGVYRLLEEEYFGAEKGYVSALDISAKNDFPFFRPEDLEITANALRSVALDPAKARKRASQLRNTLLEKFTWSSCCEDAAKAFDWDLQKGSVPDRTSEIVQEITEHDSAAPAPPLVEAGPLKIPRGQWRPAAGMADSQLLRAEEELLPFDARRQPQVDELKAWASDSSWPITVKLITGDGGQGKTRLAIHLCQQLRREGWHSGFLDSNMETNRMPLLWRDLTKLDQPILIVVDYAETRQEAFLSLLEAALQNSPPRAIRMLLLARNGGEWWDNLSSTNSSCEGLLSGPATKGPFPLPPLYAGQLDRQQAFSYALTAFSEVLHVDNLGIVPELEGDQFQRPLFVQMAALLALYGERPTTVQGLTKALLNHERRYWVGLLAPTNLHDPGRRAEQLLALTTLAGGFPTARSAESFWIAAKGNVLTTGEFNSLFRNLAALYPGAEGLQALRPDLLGEALIAQALLRPKGDVLVEALLSSSATQLIRRNALTALARVTNERVDLHGTVTTVLMRQLANCGADLVAVSTQTVSCLPDLAELAFNQLSSAVKNQVAGPLKGPLMVESVQLAGFSCAVFGHLAEQAQKRLLQKPQNLDRMLEYAIASDRYGVSLYQLAQYEKACEVGDASLIVVRKLVSKDRDRYESYYARNLMLYAVYLSEVGKADEALEYDREAVKIYQRLAKKDPDEFESDYATALDNHATHLAFLRQHKEAIAQAELALIIHRAWIEKKPDRFEGRYAHSLRNYADDLNNIGQSEDAVTQSRKAVNVYLRLVHKNPDRFEPDYAVSLLNHAVHLAGTGRIIEAVQHAERAYDIEKGLAEKQPQRFGADLVTSACFATLMRWLSGTHETGQITSLEPLISVVPDHERNLLKVGLAFVKGCVFEQEFTGRRDSFRLILSLWSELKQKDKVRVTAYQLCAAAWCAEFDSLNNTGWQVDWTEYVSSRGGKIPVWLIEVARRLGFEFPSI
jgi:glycosyltransferase involved in cell wall biosynthesis